MEKLLGALKVCSMIMARTSGGRVARDSMMKLADGPLLPKDRPMRTEMRFDPLACFHLSESEKLLRA